MSYVRIEDRFDGMRVFFNDATFIRQVGCHAGSFGCTHGQVQDDVCSWHDNDIVRVYVDDDQ